MQGGVSEATRPVYRFIDKSGAIKKQLLIIKTNPNDSLIVHSYILSKVILL